MPTERRWLTILEAAAFLCINPKTASAWALSGRIPAARIGGRGPWRVDRFRLEEGLERQIKQVRPAGVFLSSGAPRALGSRPALPHTRGNREQRSG
jgi:hypothetical protein